MPVLYDRFRILTLADRRQMMRERGIPGAPRPTARDEVLVMSPKGSVRVYPKKGAREHVRQLNERYEEEKASPSRRRPFISRRTEQRPAKKKKREGFKYHVSWAVRGQSGKIKIFKKGSNNKRDAVDRVKRAMREGAVSGIVEHTDPWEWTVYEEGGFWDHVGEWMRQDGGATPNTEDFPGATEEEEERYMAASAELRRLEAETEGGFLVPTNPEHKRAQNAYQRAEFAITEARARRREKRKAAKHKAKYGYNPSDDEIPIANPDDADWVDDLYLLWFGQAGTQKVYVWAGSFDTAFEHAVEWLDDNGMCGFFETITEAELREAADDLGIKWPGIRALSGTIDRDASKILEHAEADLTVIGHTTLKCEEIVGGPAYMKSDEWGGDEITRQSEFDEVRRRSLSKPVKLSYAVYNVFQRYWEGQDDPLYALLSRRGDDVDWVIVDASPEEIERLEETADEIIESPNDAGELRTAEAMLKQLEKLE